MPTYLYKNIDTGEIYELRQSMRDDAYTTHPESGVAVKRILARTNISFRGSGFYVNDSRSGGKSEGSSAEGSGAKSDGAKSESKAPGSESSGGAGKSASDAGKSAGGTSGSKGGE